MLILVKLLQCIQYIVTFPVAIWYRLANGAWPYSNSSASHNIADTKFDDKGDKYI